MLLSSDRSGFDMLNVPCVGLKDEPFTHCAWRAVWSARDCRPDRLTHSVLNSPPSLHYGRVHVHQRIPSMGSKSDQQSQSPPDHSNGKGKGKANASSDDTSANSGTSKPSLFSSAFGTGANATLSDMSALMTGQAKGGSSGVSAGTPQAASLAAETSRVGASAGAASVSTSLGPRQGFRTAGNGPNDTDQVQARQNSFNPNDSAQLPSPLLASAGSGAFGTFEALNQTLHDLVRQDVQQGQSTSMDHSESLEKTLSSRPELLDPAYHEAWARSIPGTVYDQAHHAQQTHQVRNDDPDFSQAWNRASSSSTTQSTQNADPYPINFLQSLAEEEALEAAKETQDETSDIKSSLEAVQSRPPPPEPSSALQATDPREALSFLLGPTDEQKAKYERQLQQLAEQVRATQREDVTSEPTMGSDRTSRRRERKRQLVQIEHELQVLEQKLGYADVRLDRARRHDVLPR